MNRFFASPEVRALSKEHGLDNYLYHQVQFSTCYLDMNRFFASPEVRALSKEHGLDDCFYHQVP